MPKKPPKRRIQDIIELIQDAYAPNTIRAYKADMEEFIAYCEARRISALPATPGTVSDFLLECATKGIRSATIRRKVASISAIHRLAEFTDPTKHPHAKLAIRKINRKLGTRFRQAYPVSKALLRSLLKACGNDLMGLRNRALLLTAYDSMRRRAELVSLRIEDIEYTTPGHARILLRKSKTDQEGTGQWVHLGKEATSAIKRWLKTSRLKSGYVFRGISPAGVPLEGLSSGQVGRIFKAVSKDAGLAEEITKSISGHSMRVGGAQDLLLNGASLPQIMVKGGWVKTDTVIRYVERVGDPIRLAV